MLFSSRELTSVNTETIVIISPHIVGEVSGPWNTEAEAEVEELERRLQRRSINIDEQLDQTFVDPTPLGGTDTIAESN